MKKSSKFFLRAGCLLAILLVTGVAVLRYRELLWALERESFFSFSVRRLHDFLSVGVLPGKDGALPFAPLFGAFFLQFYKGWGVYPAFLIFGCGFSLIAAACLFWFFRKFLSERAFWGLPLFGAVSALVWVWLSVGACYGLGGLRVAPWLAYALGLHLAVFALSGRLPERWRECICGLWLALSFPLFGGLSAATFLTAALLRELSARRGGIVPKILLLATGFAVGGIVQIALCEIRCLPAGEGLRADFPQRERGGKVGTGLVLTVARVERLCLEARYDEALQDADAYWFSHPCPLRDVVSGKNSFWMGLSEKEKEQRHLLAGYTITALIGANRLNEGFFSYYRVPEIYNGLEDGWNYAHHIAAMLRQRVLDNPTAVYSMGMNIAERNRLSYVNLQLSIPAMLACGQADLAQKYRRLLRGTLFYSQLSVDSAAVAAWREKGLNDYLDMDNIVGGCESRWAKNPASAAVLECVCLNDLLYKRLDSVLARIPDYLRLSGQSAPPYRFPTAWQEMFLIVGVGEFPVDEAVARQYARFTAAREQWRRGLKTPEALTAEFGHTFAYNYYFSRLVEMAPPAGKEPSLAH